MDATKTPLLIEHLFRHQAGLMTAVLTRIFGAQQIDLVEDVVQDALVRALEVWPLAGTPANPTAWLIEVAKNRALDVVRRHSSFSANVERALIALQPGSLIDAEAAFVPGACTDDVVAMLFLCCHPDIAVESQVALSLKVVAGLSTQEIARGLMAQESAVAQRIVRAKQQIRDRALTIDMPLESTLPRRLDSVLAVLYLWFNEGHLAHDGEELVRVDLCREAWRLVRMVATHPTTATPDVHALAALMAFHAARLPARVGSEGELLLLRDQDRALWDRTLLDLGFVHLMSCAEGDHASAFQLEAGIAACHAAAPDYARTDWSIIVGLYDRLYATNPSPVVQLNRAVAVSRLRGPAAGMALIRPLIGDPRLARYRGLPAVLGELALESGLNDDAYAWFSRALASPCSAPERRFLQARLKRSGRISRNQRQ